MTARSKWRYEPQNPKIKHHWEYPHAGFDVVHGVVVGKCPSGLTADEAEALLNGGIAFDPLQNERGYPKRIYSVKDGVVYRATPTNPGVSYHGFPEKPAELRKLPQPFQERLIALARDLGCEEKARNWMAGSIDATTGEWMEL